MPETLVNQETTNVDLTKITALQQKRTLAFINHFVISTVQFLNNFSKQCEHKLMQFERKLEKINATMVLLEAKLSSIPEVNTDTKNITKPEDTTVIINEESKERNETIMEEEKETSSDTADLVNKNKIKPEYERFLKMVQVGVPKDAVKLKISLEGLDPNELDKILL